jgi:hypothetical protein
MMLRQDCYEMMAAYLLYHKDKFGRVGINTCCFVMVHVDACLVTITKMINNNLQ